MSDYPKRSSHFAHKFCRTLTKSAAAQELGPEACWLLSVIVHQEDAIRYSRPVTFWNDQLLPLCGFGSRKRLESARRKAIEGGWIHYKPGGKSKPGRYWVTIPDAFEDLSDSPVDEGGSFEGRNGTAKERESGLRDETERNTPGQKDQCGTETAHHSTLPLNPKESPNLDGSDEPKKPKPSTTPTAEDVATAEYIRDALQKMQPGRKEPSLKNWANDVRLMRQRDKHADDLIRRVFDAAHADSFWRTNILSPAKLREKFDDLSLKLNVSLTKPPESEFLPPRKRSTS